jgi:hypothetical protein
MLKQTLLFCIILLFLPVSAPSEEMSYTIPIGDSPQMGPENAPVTIIQFIVFQ